MVSMTLRKAFTVGNIRIAIQTLLLPGRDAHEQFANAARYGFDAVEVAVGPDHDLAGHVDEIRAASRAAGIPVAAICTHPIHDPLQDDRDERERRFHVLGDLVRLSDELGAAGVVSVPLRPARPFSSPDERDQAVAALTRAAVDAFGEWAARLPTGTAAVFLEPLNRYEAFFLNRVEQAVEIARQVDNPRVMALADLFHMNIEEANLADPLAAAGRHLGHVHIADNNRLQPGAGCLDFASPFSALQASGYGGYLSIECFSPGGPLVKGEPETALPETVRFLRAQWDRAAVDGA
jgi:sugar phosphate isomerase/epimerase